MTTTAALTAWITTSAQDDTDPGLTISTETGEQLAETDVDLAEGDGIDQAHADRLLAELGYRRTGDWTLSGGQWAAEVEQA